MRPNAVSVVIPAYNERAAIASTVAASRQAKASVVEVLVIDDFSRDGTAAVARQAGAEVSRLARRSGKACALMHGARRAKGDILVFVDADVGDSATEIARLVDPIIWDEADMTIARFPLIPAGSPGGFGIVKGVAGFGVRRLCGKSVSSPLSGQRAARREVFLSLMPFAPGFGVEVGLTVDAVRRGLRVLEVDCRMKHSETGRDLAGFIHRAGQLYWVARALVSRCLVREIDIRR